MRRNQKVLHKANIMDACANYVGLPFNGSQKTSHTDEVLFKLQNLAFSKWKKNEIGAYDSRNTYKIEGASD
jgi:hypothetical protein